MQPGPLRSASNIGSGGGASAAFPPEFAQSSMSFPSLLSLMSLCVEPALSSAENGKGGGSERGNGGGSDMQGSV